MKISNNENFKQDQNLVCIECGIKINSILKIYSDGFKDIIECVSLKILNSKCTIITIILKIVRFNLKPNCKKVVDSYVECEYSIVLLDLILFKERAYRHIVFNKEIKVKKF